MRRQAQEDASLRAQVEWRTRLADDKRVNANPGQSQMNSLFVAFDGVEDRRATQSAARRGIQRIPGTGFDAFDRIGSTDKKMCRIDGDLAPALPHAEMQMRPLIVAA